MQTGHIIILDIGTTTAKVSILDMHGAPLFYASCPFRFLSKPPGYFEQDPLDVWNAITMATRDVLSKAASSGLSPKPMVLGIVSQGGSLIPCDRNGNQLYPMITWMDTRARNLIRTYADSDLDTLVRSRTGRPLLPDLPLGMMLWIKKNVPDLWNHTTRWMCLNDYILHKLTGNYITDPSSAVLTELYNRNTEVWDEDILNTVGIDTLALSEVLPSGSNCGKLTEEASYSLGLPQGLPVLNGMHDRTAEAIGLGNFHPGDSWIGTGTSWVVCTVTEENPGNRTSCNFHVLPSVGIASDLVGGIGNSVEWWASELMIHRDIPNRDEALLAVSTLAGQSPPGSHGLFFRSFTGNGNEGTFSDNSDRFSDADRSRAVLESIAFSFRKAFDRFSKEHPGTGHMTLVGGAAKSSCWPEIIANILGVELSVSTFKHDTTLGAAILAGKYLGIADSLEDIYNLFKTERTLITPNAEITDVYQRIYQKIEKEI